MNFTENDLLTSLNQLSNPQMIPKIEEFFQAASQNPKFVEILFKINMNDQVSYQSRLQAVILIQKQIDPKMIRIHEHRGVLDLTLLQERILDAIAFYYQEEAFRKGYEQILNFLVEINYP